MTHSRKKGTAHDTPTCRASAARLPDQGRGHPFDDRRDLPQRGRTRAGDPGGVVDPGGLDDLAGHGTTVVDAGDLTLLPAFADSHEHLMEASRNTLLVPVDKARSIAEFTEIVAAAARDAAPGEWILTSISWHESNLAENRVPTMAELDAAVPDHPVLARRGGHFAVANSAALRAAGIGPDTPDPPGGRIGRLADGSRDGA